ncbi:acyl transferase/acyl hydrolase/lysophospholipase [Myxozyma melibiosi]|uniref:Acyl transferase/acyl hydrolase/lysophospholipase n=1 Tax=Myxozyma melibiosi TaxID=54550 RepID=A0ABR1F4G5_9ASCO
MTTLFSSIAISHDQQSSTASPFSAPSTSSEHSSLVDTLASKLIRVANKFYLRDNAASAEQQQQAWETPLHSRDLGSSIDSDDNGRQKRLEVAYALQEHATSYDEWARASQELDYLLGYDTWKMDPVSDEYDYKLLMQKVHELRTLRQKGDYLKLLFFLRTTLTRNPANIGNPKLYTHSHIGTKYLIDDYITECEESLQTVLNCPIPAGMQGDDVTYVDESRKLDELLRTRHAFGRTALLLSGGGTLGMLHSGVLEALHKCGLLPKIISGSSAGAIVAAALCTRSDQELPELLSNFQYFNLDVFEETGNEESVWTRIARFLKHGAWTDISYLVSSMQEVLGQLTFQEAYNRTRRVLNIPVSSATVYEPPRLLNYLTAPNVFIWSAVCASCSVPFVFLSHTLMAKDPRTSQPVPWNPTAQRWIDGSVDNDLPMSRLNEMFNVNHFIVSQVNPHIVPFLKPYDGVSPDLSASTEESKAEASSSSASPQKSTSQTRKVATGIVGNFLAKSCAISDSLINLAVTETMHRLEMTSEIGILPNLCTKLRSVLAQTYSGDITIMPQIYVSELNRILKNPTPEFLLDAKIRGHKATWPKISIIRNHCAIELALDSAIIDLRSRTIMNSMVVGAKKLSSPYLLAERQRSSSFYKNKSRRSYDAHGRAGTPVSEGFSKSLSEPATVVREASTTSGVKIVLADESSGAKQAPSSSSEASRVEADEMTLISRTDDDVNINLDDDEDEDDEGGYMMGVYPEDTDFDIGSPVETKNLTDPFLEARSAPMSPSASSSSSSSSSTVNRRNRRSASLLQQPTTFAIGVSPPGTPRAHRRRTSGDGYFYNYFNYSTSRIPSYGYQQQNFQALTRQMSKSQPSTPSSRNLLSRQASALNIHEVHDSSSSRIGKGKKPQTQNNTSSRRVSFDLAAPSSADLRNRTQSLGSSPKLQMVSLSGPSSGMTQHQRQLQSALQLMPQFQGLPPSVDADYDGDEIATLSTQSGRHRQVEHHMSAANDSDDSSSEAGSNQQRYWPLQYDQVAATTVRPGASQSQRGQRVRRPPIMRSMSTPSGRKS